MTFTSRNALNRIRPQWWVDIEGIQHRYGTVQPSWAPPVEGLLAYYSLDSNANDLTGNGYTGTVEKTTSYPAGKVGTCLDFDGASYGQKAIGPYQCVNLGTSFSNLNKFSVSLWVNTDEINIPTLGTSRAPYLYSVTQTSPSKDVFSAVMVFNVAYYTFFVGYNGGDVSVNTPNLSTGTWYHFVQTFDGSTMRLYTNGSLTGSATIPGGLGIVRWEGIPMLLGACTYSSATNRHNHFNGRLDEVAIFNRAITADEVAAIYASGSGLTWPWRGIKPYMARVPKIGSQQADPMNGACSIPSHGFSLQDVGYEITDLVAVSDTPYYRTRLTAPITSSQTTIPVEDKDELPATGVVYLDRETICYSGTSETTSSGNTATDGYSALTVDSSDLWYIIDADVSEPDHFWDGAKVSITSGANNGLIRIVALQRSTMLSFDSPLPVACGAGDTYTLHMPPNKIRCSGISSVDDDLNGAVITVTAGTCAGEVVWVMDTVATMDTMTVSPSFSKATDGTTVFSVVRGTITGCTRGSFGSQASAHEILDRYNVLAVKWLTTKVPFLKTRMMKIYEGREDEAEAQYAKTGGYLTDYSLDASGVVYDFAAGGLLRILSQDFVWSQVRGKLYRNLWGGKIAVGMLDSFESSALGGGNESTPAETNVAEDGGTSTTDHVEVGSNDTWESKGNVKVDEEIIHYLETGSAGFYTTAAGALSLSTQIQTLKFTSTDQRRLPNYTDWVSLAGPMCLACRGLFSEKFGRHGGWFKQAPGDIASWTSGFALNDMKLFTQAHETNADVVSCLVCDASPWSDFPRYDLITYSSLAGGSFAAGNTIAGATSLSTATVMRVTTYTATTGELLIAYTTAATTFVAAAFTSAETISVGAVSATVGIFSMQVRPRNNALDAVLQLLTSTGTRAANGAYDTLPYGFGLGIDEDLIDVEGIEELRDRHYSSMAIDFVMHEKTPAKDWLETNVFRLLQVFPFETHDGKIGLARLVTRAEAVAQDALSSVVAFDASHIRGMPSWTGGKNPVSKIIIKHNKHPVRGDYLATTEMHFAYAEDWYEGMADVVELSVDTYYVVDQARTVEEHNSPLLPAVVRNMTASVWDRQGMYPCPAIGVVTGYADIETDIGDVVKITHSALPNVRTSARGLTAEYYQVIAKTPNPTSGSIDWELWQIGVHDAQYGQIAPCAEVLTYAADTPSAGKSTLTFKGWEFSRATITTVLAFANDVSFFSAADKVMFFDAAMVPIVNPIEVATIESATALTSTVVLTANLSHAPIAGEIMSVPPYDSCTAIQKAKYAFMAGADRKLGASGEEGYRYE